ncbi:MAG: hypothetical protein NUV81_02250 [bacterium]|nr:hypothetical protein [bacterium]
MKKISLFFILAFLIFQSSGPALASNVDLTPYPNFNPNLILTDSDIFNENAISQDRFVAFLRSKGTLADQRKIDIDGIEKSVPDIIWRVAQTYKVNPKYLVVLLQKEQSLVENPSPTDREFDWATGYGVCDSCSKDDPDLLELKGFANQLEWAAKQHREKYLLQLLTGGLTIGGFGVNLTKTVDGIQITPGNKATAMLYSYTPHIQGNLNLWKIWNRWFRVKYPDGTLVRDTTTNQAYLIRFDEKRPFASEAVLASLTNPERAILTTSADLDAYPTGAQIRFPKWALLQEPDGEIYLYTGDEKRHIADTETFRKLGFNSDEIIPISADDLSDIAFGTEITSDSEFPQGVLMQVADTNSIFYVEDGVRHSIVDPIFIKLYFRGRQIRQVPVEEIQKYSFGKPYTLHTGELVRSQDTPAVYVLENDVLRPILSAEVFESVGWDWKSVVFLSDSLITMYPIGDMFDPDQTQYTNLASSPL